VHRVCIHGHFYQPPREDPWTGDIIPQPSALPFPDWNHRITAECYRANVAAAIMGEDGGVADRVRTYDHISFNFGPTLLRWMSEHAPDVVAALVAADQASQARLGHGNAVAQAYHHLILPLANARDQRTEVRWGVADFEHRFGRAPEGMWLPETAVDTATLEVLAEEGVQFVILAPRQAAAVKAPGKGEDWTEVHERSLDPARPYRVDLPSGRSIAAFFYAPTPASGVAFAGWLDNGERMAHRLVDEPGPLVHYATDGESYGHHHRYGEMALAYCVRTLQAQEGVVLTNYATELARGPVDHEARIVEQSSWSCAHGVGRWSRNCGCTLDGNLDLQQEWRVHLRGALDWLRDALAEFSEAEAERLGVDLWDLRDRYIFHLLGDEAGAHHPRDPLPDDWQTDPAGRRLQTLLELQRHALMMFTSCGWFFDDPARVEPVQILRYALRAMTLHEVLGGRSLEGAFMDRLAPIRSVDPEIRDGRDLWLRRVVRDGLR
jgi:alpha-amylase/alpha-mannosidase (GH57 family)